MRSSVDLDVLGPNNSVNDVNFMTNHTGALFIVVNAFLESASLFV